MHLEQLTVKNFKGFTKQTFEFHPEFNLLIGGNGSGKSSALHAIGLALSQIGVFLNGGDVAMGLRTSQIRHLRLRVGESIRFERSFPSRSNGKENLQIKR